MDFNNKADLLDYLVNSLPNASEGITFDYDDEDDGVAYVETATGSFKIKVEKNNGQD